MLRESSASCEGLLLILITLLTLFTLITQLRSERAIMPICIVWPYLALWALEQRVDLAILLRLLKLLCRAPAVAKSQLQKIQSNLKDLVNTVVREGVI